MNTLGLSAIAQRTMACRSDRDARYAAIVLTVAQVLVKSLFWIPIGADLLILIWMKPGASVGAIVAAR